MKLEMDIKKEQQHEETQTVDNNTKLRTEIEVRRAIETVENYLMWLDRNWKPECKIHKELALAQRQVLYWFLGENNAFEQALINDRKIRGLVIKDD